MTGEPLGLRDRARRDRIARIRAAAEELMLDARFEDITTKALAERAEVGEATLFRYIKSKQALLMMVYGDRLDALLETIEGDDAAAADAAAADGARGHIDRVLHVYSARCAFYLESPHNAALYLRAGFDPHDSSAARLTAQGDRTIALVAGILRDGQQAGALIAGTDMRLVAQNCHAAYMHEIDRTPVRGFEPSTIWERLEPRLAVQLEPLALTPRG